MTSRGFAAAIVTFLLGLGVALTGCAQQGPSAVPSGQSEGVVPPVTVPPETVPPESVQPETVQPSTASGQVSPTATGGRTGAPRTGGASKGGPDGIEDPKQQRTRTGPVASFGGPAYGDQGIEEIEPGKWCDTIAVFWGGDTPIPSGVTFRFDRAVTDPPSGLEVQRGICGTKGADRTCLGLTIKHDASNITCSIVLLPSPKFVEDTEITFVGTLTCPTSAVCDRVAARSVEAGPAIVVTTPPGASSPGGDEVPKAEASPGEGSASGGSPSAEDGSTPSASASTAEE